MSEFSKFSGLSCELIIPFSWGGLNVLEKDSLVLIERDNISRLQIIRGLEESSSDTLDELPGLAQEIHRLDTKINVLLELVAHIATQENGLPQPSSLILSSDAIQWTSQQAPPEMGSQLKVALFLERRFPFPLIFSGEVESVSPQGSLSQVFVKLHPMAEPLRELLEKFVFRCHRRHVARIKRQENL